MSVYNVSQAAMDYDYEEDLRTRDKRSEERVKHKFDKEQVYLQVKGLEHKTEETKRSECWGNNYSMSLLKYSQLDYDAGLYLTR